MDASKSARPPDPAAPADRAIGYRRATEHDEKAIFTVLESANFHRVPSPEMPSLDLRSFFVAEDARQIVGVAGFTILGDRGKTTLMAVLPSHRGLGVGRRLHELRLDAMRARGCRVAVTNADLQETIDWYRRKFGYRIVGTVEKLHEFGAPHIDRWTTLEVELERPERPSGEDPRPLR